MNERFHPLFLAVIFMIVAAILGGFFALFLEPLADQVKHQGTLSYGETGNSYSSEDYGIATAQKILPSVVGIRAEEKTMVNGISALSESSGSGVILSSDGYIITNHHVIADRPVLRVIFHDGSEAEAALIGSDKYTDLALIKVERTDLSAATLAPESPKVGQAAYAVGNPGGLDFAGTVTKGIVSGIDRTLVTDSGSSFLLIQTDAAINPGNSGGALCNAKGEVIGINVLKISEEGFEGMGFAIPISTVSTITKELKETGSIHRGSLGVYLLCNVTESVAEVYHTDIDYGVLIGTREGGAAEKAGLKDHDIITAFNGETIYDMYDLQRKVFALHPKDRVSVTVWRNGEFLDHTIILEELKEE